MNHCIKTGADVWDEAAGCAIHCDAYFVSCFLGDDSGVYLFRYVEPFIFSDKKNKPKDLKNACHFWLQNEQPYEQHECLVLESAQVLAVPARLVKSRIDNNGEIKQ